MFKTGLVSITFREKTVEEIIELVSDAGLDGIEWGGDIHVPHGDVKRAKEVYIMTKATGLNIAAYGSYYKVGCKTENSIEFKKVLQTAIALHAPTIRVWAGNISSKDSDQIFWENVVNESREIAEMAEKEGVTVSFEYHPHTLTDTTESANKLLKNIDHPNIYSYWQPSLELNMDECLYGLKRVKPWLTNIHVYYWRSGSRMSLSEGADEWYKYIDEIKNIEGEHYFMLEFVKDDSSKQFYKDAKVLKELVKQQSIM